MQLVVFGMFFGFFFVWSCVGSSARREERRRMELARKSLRAERAEEERKYWEGVRAAAESVKLGEELGKLGRWAWRMVRRVVGWLKGK